ncbi:MAG: ribosomal protein L7/L12 [Bdellovibrionales bacterium]|nr:ribosomal protein L7/L12 [Bdellovibrionales bacterium]
MSAPKDIPASAKEKLRLGRKIEAIKIVREELSLGLKEAKELVEQHVEGQPQGTYQELEKSVEIGKGLLFWVLVGIAVVAYIAAR